MTLGQRMRDEDEIGGGSQEAEVEETETDTDDLVVGMKKDDTSESPVKKTEDVGPEAEIERREEDPESLI